MTETVQTAASLTAERQKFVVDDTVAYFNTAAMSPTLRGAHEAAQQALHRRSRPWSIATADWFEPVEELRTVMARLMGVSASDAAIVPSSSYGLGAVAKNLGASPGDRVLVLDQEFPSNYYTWHRFAQRTGAELVLVRREPGQTWGDAVLAAIDERVAVASLPNVHWTNGALVDLERIAPALRDAGATFVIDASQSLGAMPLDIANLRPDAVVAVGYKWLLGPYSLGYLYLDPQLHDGEPLEENWITREGSDDFSAVNVYRDEYRGGAQRFDVGERSNFQLTPMATAAIRQILEWTIEGVATALRARTDAIASAVERLGLRVPPRDGRGPHILGIELPGHTARRVATALDDSRVVVSARGPSLRVAPHLHNDERDIDRLIDALAAAV